MPWFGTGRGDFLIYAALSITAGHLMTAVVEKPMLRLRDRWLPPRRRLAAAA